MNGAQFILARCGLTLVMVRNLTIAVWHAKAVATRARRLAAQRECQRRLRAKHYAQGLNYLGAPRQRAANFQEFKGLNRKERHRRYMQLRRATWRAT